MLVTPAGVGRLAASRETRKFLSKGCIEMIHDIRKGADDIRNASRQNPKYPSDFYSMLLREADIKVLAIRELYMRLIGEELE